MSSLTNARYDLLVKLGFKPNKVGGLHYIVETPEIATGEPNQALMDKVKEFNSKGVPVDWDHVAEEGGWVIWPVPADSPSDAVAA